MVTCNEILEIRLEIGWGSMIVSLLANQMLVLSWKIGNTIEWKKEDVGGGGVIDSLMEYHSQMLCSVY